MKIANKLLENIKHINEQEYTYISVRLKPEYYYMLDLIAYLNNVSIGSLLTKEISDYLFKMICMILLEDNVSNDEIILDIKKASENPICYNMLINNEFIIDNEAKKKIDEIMNMLNLD